MKKTILTILCFIAIISITGCDKKINNLNSINNKIVEYYLENDAKGFENYIFNYIDEKDMTVVVALENNNEEMQKEFKENVVDSNLIKFIQLEESYTSNEVLNNVKNKISSILKNKDYNNISSYLIDEGKKAVVIRLVNNSKEEQKKFRQTIFNSKYISFEHGNINTLLKNQEQINNSYQSEVAIKVDSLIKKDNIYPNYFGGMYISDDSKNLIIQLVKDNIPKESNTSEYDTYNKMLNIDSSIKIKYVKNSYNDLNEINNKIIKYFSSNNAKYNNLNGNYVDVINNIVVVELLENNEEQREEFKRLVVDSNLITFVEEKSTFESSN